MPLRSPSLHSVVALSLLVMAALALALVFFSARTYRDVAVENRVSAIHELVGQRTRDILKQLAQNQELLAHRLAGRREFRAAWDERNLPELRRLTRGAMVREVTAPDGMPLRQIRLLDAGMLPVVQAGGSDVKGCTSILTEALQAGASGTLRRSCLRDGGVSLSVLVPIESVALRGYVEIVSDPIARFRRLAQGAPLAVRIERPGGSVLGQSDDWQRLANTEGVVETRYLPTTAPAVPVFTIRAAADIGRLQSQLADTRTFVLVAAATIIALAMVIVLVTLRQTLKPLRALQRAAEAVRQQGGRSEGFQPVPVSGPQEIATPMRSFNQMVERVSGLLADLDAEVEQRRQAETAATSARELAETHARQAAHEKEFSQTTLEAIVDGVLATDAAGRVEYMNPVAERLTGLAEDEVLGEDIDRAVALYDVTNGERLPQPLTPSADNPASQVTPPTNGHETRRPLACLFHPSGRTVYLEYAVVAMPEAEGAPVGRVVVLHDVTEAHRLTQRLTYQAQHDALTGLINRYEFEGQLVSICETVAAGGDTGVLCYLDLDEFKLVNDTCGHVAGDELLRQLALMLTDRLGQRGTLARLGGDEFGLLLHPARVDEARAVAEDLRAAIEGFRFVWAERIFTISVSVGLVEITQTAGGTDELLSAADTACYIAKENGRNRVQVYHSEDAALLQRQAEMQWVAEINEALEDDRFELCGQPIYPANGDGPPRHFEILVRMVDANGHVWPPGAFLVAAERYNLAPAIDQRVVTRALAWLADGALERDCLYAINLSGRSICADGFLEFVLGELERCAIAPANICFEITETAAIANLRFARTFMKTLRAHGCRFALDDFGSGLSSFTYLQALPVDFLKIDGAFVRDLDEDPIHYAVVRSMNDVGHAFSMETIAEFVESAEAVHCLREIGVDFLQGYAYASPERLTEQSLGPAVDHRAE